MELKKILGYDPMAIGENTFDKVVADLMSKDLHASQLSNGVHLELVSLVASQRITRKESTALHARFLEKE